MLKRTGTSPHISDADLIQFADGEMPVKAVTAAETHLRTCGKCRERLHELRSGADAYDRYHAQLLMPALELSDEWSRVAARLKTLETPSKPVFPGAMMGWGAVALVCCCLIAAWSLSRESPARRMQQLLVRAVQAPARQHRRLEVTANGLTWYRAATLRNETTRQLTSEERGLSETRALFIEANYSWEDPLSARSFADWRKHLQRKHDQVFSIEDSDGKKQFYRLRTETPTGVLRTAALTLRADTLNPVKGAFYFDHHNDVTITDAGEMPERPGSVEAKGNPSTARPAIVKEVGPAEELRVFAALDAIGADVGESVTVDVAKSKRQVIVSGLGVPAARERQIRQALARVPNIDVQFTSQQVTGTVNPGASTSTPRSGNAGSPLLHMLETRAGGPQAFQTIADEALGDSNMILQQAHALHVLAQTFPPAVAAQFGQLDQQTLRGLRRRHAIGIAQTTAELQNALKPIVNAPAPPDETRNKSNTSWEVGAGLLYEQAKLLDDSLGRLLAGTYSQEAGQSIWNKLPDEIQRVEVLAVSQEKMP